VIGSRIYFPELMSEVVWLRRQALSQPRGSKPGEGPEPAQQERKSQSTRTVREQATQTEKYEDEVVPSGHRSGSSAAGTGTGSTVAPLPEGVASATNLLDAVLAHDAMVAAINAASSAVDVMAYTFDQPDIVCALKRAAARGVPVRLLVDRDFSMSGRCRRQLRSLQELAECGCFVRLLAGVPDAASIYGGAQHSKSVRADGVLVLGSCNLTTASRSNFELDVRLVLTGTGLQEFSAMFGQRWARGLALGGASRSR